MIAQYPHRADAVIAECDSPEVTGPGSVTPAASLILSLYPGIDLFGRAFELAGGYAVVRGPDTLWGQDIRDYHFPGGRVDGVIGGSPCPSFSSLRRGPERGDGRELVGEFLRVVAEAKPQWFLLENVPRVPNVAIDGYIVQRIDLCGADCGMRQMRRRHFQFGSVTGRGLVVSRRDTPAIGRQGIRHVPAAVASEGRRSGRRGWHDFCALQGIAPIDLPGMTLSARYRAVGNAVPLPMGILLAQSIKAWIAGLTGDICCCGCGRIVSGRRSSAGAACRKRIERRRRGVIDLVSVDAAGSLVTDLVSGDSAQSLRDRRVTSGGFA